MSSKEPDEMYCRSCGEIIKKEAEICPECGVRNESAKTGTQSGSRGPTSVGHDPGQYETTVSDTWWYGIAGGVVLWIFLILVAGSVASGGILEALLGLIALIAWAIMPVAVYFDAKYVRANGRWNPNTALWVIGMLIWLVNIVAGGVYLYRRHEVLGEP